jgi:hypothetical protein
MEFWDSYSTQIIMTIISAIIVGIINFVFNELGNIFGKQKGTSKRKMFVDHVFKKNILIKNCLDKFQEIKSKTKNQKIYESIAIILILGFNSLIIFMDSEFNEFTFFGLIIFEYFLISIFNKNVLLIEKNNTYDYLKSDFFNNKQKEWENDEKLF